MEHGTWNMEYGIMAGFQHTQEKNSGIQCPFSPALRPRVANPH